MGTKIYVKYDIDAICTKVLKGRLEAFGLDYTLSDIGEVHLTENLSEAGLQELSDALAKEDIEVVDDTESELAHRIKQAITQLIYSDHGGHRYKTSTYLSDKLNYSYGHLSDVFSQTTLGSIENFVILKKIDYAKALIVEGQLSFSEIAYKLNYSSSSHLSAQFKRTTGLTPSRFQRLIQKRRERRASTAQNLQPDNEMESR